MPDNRLLYVPYDCTDVYRNFALETYFAEEKQLTGRPVFLFWRTTPTIMLGKYQNALAEMNTAYCEEHDVQVVRRLSGGGTIYTDLGGWQFSFIQPQDKYSIEFEGFIEPVVAALNNLGIPAAFNGRNDLVVAGKKFSGNAQYKMKGFVVHHGSLLFDTDLEAIVRSTTVPDYKLIAKGIESVRDRVTNLKDHLPAEHRGMTVEAFGDYMVSYLSGCGEDRDAVLTYTLSDAERERLEVIAAERYRSESAIWGRDPRFSLELSEQFAGGRFTLKLDVYHGIVRDALPEGDFFGNISADEFSAVLRGVRFEREAIRAALKAACVDEALYKISSDDIAAMIPETPEII